MSRLVTFPLKRVGKDVAGDVGHHVVIVGQPEHAHIERQGMGEQETMQEVVDALCRGL